MAAYNLTVQLNLQGPRNLNNVVTNINRQLNNVQATVNVQTSPQAAQALQQLANSSRSVQQNADDATNSMERFGRSAGLAVKRFAAFTAATAGFYAVTRATTQSLERFIEYDKQLIRIAQVTGTTKDSLGSLSNTITQLSTTLGASSGSLAQVAVTLSQAGLSAKQTEQALKSLALTTLAPTFNDINQTVEGSIALMKQFSISTTQLESALGSINAVAGQFAVEASDIITAIQRTGGVFAAASNGVSEGTDALNEFIAVFTSVRATTRESAETIATGLRTIFSRIQREDTIEALKAFGVQLTDLEGKFVGPYVAIQRLAEGLRSLDPRDLQFSSLVEELGGFRQVGKVIPLIQQFTIAQQALNVAQRGSGSLATDAALGQQSLAVQIAKVQQEFDALIRSIGQTKEFQQFIRLSLDLASALIQVADSVKPLVPALAALGAVGFARGIPSIARGFRRGIGATGYASGGLVPGSGSRDTVPAMLTPGEYVIRKKAVQSLGVDRLSSINKYGRGGSVQRFQEGGMSKKEHFAHLDAGPNVYRDGKYWGKGLSGWGIMLPEKWNTDLARGNAGISGAELKAYIQNSKLEQTFARQLGIGQNSGQAGSFRAGRSNRYYEELAKNLIPIKQSILNSIDPSKIYNTNADMYPIGKSMMEAVKNISPGLSKELSKVGKVQLTSKSPLQELGRKAGDYDTITSRTLAGVKKLSFRQRKQEMFSTRYKKRSAGGPINEVQALLTPGEFVINKKSASKLGRSALDNLNNADKLPKYHSGGAVGNIKKFAAGGNVDSSTGGIGSTIGLAFALQAAAGMFATSIEDASTEGAATMGGSIKGAVSGLTTGLIGGEIAGFIPGLSKFSGGIGIAAGAALALTQAFISSKNAALDFANKLSKQKIENETYKISRAFETLSQDVNNVASVMSIVSSIGQATRETSSARNRQTESTRIGYGNLLEEFFGQRITGGMTANQIAAGTSEQSLSAQRSLVLEMKGLNAYLNTLGSYVGDDQTAQKNLANEIRGINKIRAAESSREFASIADSAIMLIEQRLKQGINLDEIIDSDSFKQFAEALARSNPAVERFILNTQSNTELTQAEKDARIQSVISTRAEIEARQRTIAVVKQLEIENAKSAGKTLETVLARVFQNMEQAFNATATGIANDFSNIDLNTKALSGKASIGLGEDVSKSILTNPLAYGKRQVADVAKSLKPLLGDQADLVGNLAIASTEIEGKILAAINSAIKNNPDANPEAISTIIRKDIKNIIENLSLPPELGNVLGQQIISAVDELRTKGKDKVGLDNYDVRSSVVGFADTIDSLSGSMKILLDAQDVYSSALEKYVATSNTITELMISKNQYLQNSFNILSEGALKLNEAFGQIITAGDIQAQESQAIRNMTGGLSDPTQIFREILNLNSKRNMLQGSLENNRDPGSFDQFQVLNNALISTNTELSSMQQALKSVAESSKIADAALSDIARQQEKRQQQAGFLEQLVSSTPEQIQSLNQAYSDMQRLLSGQSNTIYTSIEAQKAYIDTLRSARYDPINGSPQQQAQRAAEGVLAQERGNVMSLVTELAPFLGSAAEANNLRADILASQLSAIGQLTPQFARVIESVRNPEQDPDVRESILVYRESLNRQTEANRLLGTLNEISARNAAESSANAIANALARTPLILSAQSARDIASNIQVPVGRSSGGIIYAAQGQMVQMTPKGTDTVPAMLTPGEFVVNKQATSQNRGLLESINNGRTRYYQYGGFVSSSFDPGASRQQTESGLADIEDWQKWSEGFNQARARGMFTAKNFARFSGTDLQPEDRLPQNINGSSVTSIDQLKSAIYKHFSNSQIFPGQVPELIVEKVGEFDSDTPKQNYKFGVASKIARATKDLGIDAKYAGDIPENRYSEIAMAAGITRDALLSYVKSYTSEKRGAAGKYDIEKISQRLTFYQDPNSISSSEIMTPINPEIAGLYGISQSAVPNMSKSKTLTEQDFGKYKLQFNSLASVIRRPPADLPIVDGYPSAKSAIAWNLNDGKYHNLYESFGRSTPLGIDIKGPIAGWLRPYYSLSASGSGGQELSGQEYGQKYSDIKAKSEQVFELAQEHRDILGQRLQNDPQVQSFVDNLMGLYSGSIPSADLSSYARFFRDKNPPITGLSEAVYKKFQEKAREANDVSVFPFAKEWSLENINGPRKRLGLLRTPEQIEKLKNLGNLEKVVQDEDKTHYSIDSALNEKSRIGIPLSAQQQRDFGMRSLPIDIPTPYVQYSGDFYDDARKTYLTNNKQGLKNKIIPLYSEYDSFLNNQKNPNDLMYNSAQEYKTAISNQILRQKQAIADYIFNSRDYDANISLSSSGHFGSTLKNKIYSPNRGNQVRNFSIKELLLPSLDALKPDLLSSDFKKPADQRLDPDQDDSIIASRFNDMLVDSIRQWGGIYGPLAGVVRQQGIRQAKTGADAIAGSRFIADRFLAESNNTRQHLSYRSLAYGYAKVFDNISSGTLRAFSRQTSRNKVDVDTRGAALSFGQRHWLDRSGPGAPNLQLPDQAGFINEAMRAVENNPQLPRTFGQLFDLLLDPYNKYNDKNARSNGLGEIYSLMVGERYYERQRKGPVPSAAEARIYYQNLKSWYSGIQDWVGQDTIAAELSGLNTIEEKIRAFTGYRLNPQRYRSSNQSHILLGAGIYGSLPTLRDIAQINGINPGAIPMVRAPGRDDGGVQMLNQALAEQASLDQYMSGSNNKSVNIQWGDQATPVTSQEFNKETLADVFKKFGASEEGIKQAAQAQTRRRNATGPNVFDTPVGANANLGDLVRNIPGFGLDALSATGGALAAIFGQAMRPGEALSNAIFGQNTQVGYDLVKFGLGMAAKPGERLSSGLYSAETMASPNSYISGAPLQDITENMSGLSYGIGVAADFASPDPTDLLKVGKLVSGTGAFATAGLSGLFPTAVKLGEGVSSYAAKEARRRQANALIRSLSKKERKGLATSQELTDLAMWREQARESGSFAEGLTPEAQRIIDKYLNPSRISAPTPATPSSVDNITAKIDFTEAPRPQEGFEGIGLIDDSRKRLPDLADPRPPTAPAGTYTVNSDAIDPADIIHGTGTKVPTVQQPRFTVSGIDVATGKEMQDVIEAANGAEAVAKMRKAGYFIRGVYKEGSEPLADKMLGALGFGRGKDKFDVSRLTPQPQAASRVSTPVIDTEAAAIAASKQAEAASLRASAVNTLVDMGKQGARFKVGGQSLSYDQLKQDPALLERAIKVIQDKMLEAEAKALGYANGGIVSPNYLAVGGVATAGVDMRELLGSEGGSLSTGRQVHIYAGGPLVRPWRQGGAADESTDFAYWKKNQLQQNYGWMRNGTPSQQQQYRQMELAIEKGYGLDPVGRPVFNNPVTKYTDPMSSLVDLEILRSGGNPGKSFYGQPGMRGGTNDRYIPGLYNRGGKVSYLANGGQLVNYAPQGTDTVPAMLTPGEFVVNRSATQKHLPLLNAINKSKGGTISPNYLAVGGVATAGVDMRELLGSEGGSLSTGRQVHIYGGGPIVRPWRQGTGTGYTGRDEYKDRVAYDLKRLDEFWDRPENRNLLIDSPQAQEQYRLQKLAMSKGFGYDAVGRPVFNNSIDPYGDPRAYKKDLAALFDDPNDNIGWDTEIGFSGGAFGSYARTIGKYANGGKVQYLANGGQLVNYQPQGTDTVPAMLTPGEFVVNKKATRQNLGLLQAINKSSGGKINNGILYAENGTDGPVSATMGGGGGTIQVTVQNPTIDFSQFTGAVSYFSIIVGQFTSPIEKLAGVDFGVINTGATNFSNAMQNFSTTSRTLGSQISRFNTAVNNFSNKTNEFIRSINDLKLNGTITVQGSIAMQPLTVNIAGLESIEARIQGMAGLVARSLARGLATSNPGMDVSQITTSDSYYS